MIIVKDKYGRILHTVERPEKKSYGKKFVSGTLKAIGFTITTILIYGTIMLWAIILQ